MKNMKERNMDDMKLAKGIVLGVLIALTFGWTYTYDTDWPLGSDAPSVLDDSDRLIKDAVQERMNVDHYWPLTGSEVSDSATGQHRQIEFYGPIATPTSAANKSWLYSKDVTAKAELHWLDEDDNEIQLTSAGKIKKASIEDCEANLLNPPGVIACFGGSSAPTGWLLCNGAAVSRTTYSDLFTIVGETYGVGNGVTTFNVPDMRGRIPVGLDAGNVNLAAGDALGETGGEENHTLTIAEMPAHNHGGQVFAHFGGLVYLGGTGSNMGATAVASQGGGGAHNNLQPYNTVNYIIKY